MSLNGESIVLYFKRKCGCSIFPNLFCIFFFNKNNTHVWVSVQVHVNVHQIKYMNKLAEECKYLWTWISKHIQELMIEYLSTNKLYTMILNPKWVEIILWYIFIFCYIVFNFSWYCHNIRITLNTILYKKFCYLLTSEVGFLPVESSNYYSYCHLILLILVI